MTQEQNNPIDAAQTALDNPEQKQAATPSPQYATTADMQKLITEVRGTQSLFDKGITAVRRDLTAQMKQELETLKADAAIEGLPEETKIYVSPLIARIRGLEERFNNTPSAPTEPVAPTGNAELNTFLEGMGLKENTAGLDIAAYNRGDMDTFLKSTASAIRSTSSETPAAPAAAAPASTSPPVDGTPAGGSGSGSIWDTYDLYNAGQIDQTEFDKRIATASPSDLNQV